MWPSKHLLYYLTVCCLGYRPGEGDYQSAHAARGLFWGHAEKCTQQNHKMTFWNERCYTFLLEITFFNHEQLTQNNSVSSLYLDWTGYLAAKLDYLLRHAAAMGRHPFSAMVCVTALHFFQGNNFCSQILPYSQCEAWRVRTGHVQQCVDPLVVFPTSPIWACRLVTRLGQAVSG